MGRYLALVVILVGYVVVGGLYALYTPAWQAPDEPAHSNYVRQLAAGRLPVMEAGDYDEVYRGEVVSSRFDPRYEIESLTYEDWQPPLYYLLQTPVYRLSGGSLRAMRLFSVLVGAGVVALAYAVAEQVFGERQWLVWTAAVFVAFLPQHVAILASVNNDSLAELLIGGILWVLLAYTEQGKDGRHFDKLSAGPGTEDRRYLVGLGVLLGLGFLTKGTVYLMVPVVGIGLLWRFWGAWGRLARAGALVAVPALLLGGLWWGRNVAVYGGLDVLGKAAHDAAVVGQPRTTEWIALYGLAETVGRLVQTTFNSFWGQFGWMALPLPGWVYRVLIVLSGMVVVGLVVNRRPETGDGRRETGDWRLEIGEARGANRQGQIANARFLILGAVFVLSLGLYVGYNLTFVQHQGRYLFPALIPIAVGVASGLGVWLRPLARWRPVANYLLPVGLGLGLAGLSLLALFRFIVPCLSVVGCGL